MRYAEDAAWREREQARQRAKFQSQSREQRARHRKQKTEWQRRHAPIPFSLEFRWLAAHRATLSPPAATAKQPFVDPSRIARVLECLSQDDLVTHA